MTGTDLRTIREALGLTQVKLAQRLGYDKPVSKRISVEYKCEQDI